MANVEKQQVYSDQLSYQNQLAAHWISSHLPNQQIQQISELAKDVFGDEAVAKEWLLEPNLATDNKPPIDLLGSVEGYARIHTLLKRIEYGVLT
jgi:putative toxin-antitoxin system antitoxin component (TIGR02293 family)